jgi:TRAP-type C4-dicarboxylate transport system permease small subunit
MMKVLLVVAGIALMVMMAIVVGNSLGRAFFRTPILGTIEIAGLAGVVVVAIAIGFTERERSHIVVDVVANRFTPRIKALADALTLTLCLGGVAFLLWAIFDDAYNSLILRETTLTTGVLTAPFKFSWAVGVLILFLFLLHHMIGVVKRGRRG